MPKMDRLNFIVHLLQPANVAFAILSVRPGVCFRARGVGTAGQFELPRQRVVDRIEPAELLPGLRNPRRLCLWLLRTGPIWREGFQGCPCMASETVSAKRRGIVSIRRVFLRFVSLLIVPVRPARR